MNLPRIVTAILVLNGAGFLMIANLIYYMILGEVNAKRPEDNQVSVLGGHPLKYQAIIKEHRRLYPKSRRTRHMDLATLLGFLSILAGMIVFGSSMFS